MADVLDRTTLADLLQRVEAARASKSRSPLMYDI
jgi:hypothetical protein